MMVLPIFIPACKHLLANLHYPMILKVLEGKNSLKIWERERFERYSSKHLFLSYSLYIEKI